MLESNTSTELLSMALAELYRGRSFLFAGEQLSPHHAFSAIGALPMFSARAARLFRFMHPQGLPITHCLGCGNKIEGNTCTPGCTKRQPGPIHWPMQLGVTRDEACLTGVAAELNDNNPSLFLAMFYIHDVAQEALRLTENPRAIPIDYLLEDLTQELGPALAAAAPTLERPHRPS